MTDPRTDALTAPTTDPGIVAALVYVGDQIAAMAAGSDRTAARTPDSPDREPVEGSRSAGPGERHTAPTLIDYRAVAGRPKEDQ